MTKTIFEILGISRFSQGNEMKGFYEIENKNFI